MPSVTDVQIGHKYIVVIDFDRALVSQGLDARNGIFSIHAFIVECFYKSNASNQRQSFVHLLRRASAE